MIRTYIYIINIFKSMYKQCKKDTIFFKGYAVFHNILTKQNLMWFYEINTILLF